MIQRYQFPVWLLTLLVSLSSVIAFASTTPIPENADGPLLIWKEKAKYYLVIAVDQIGVPGTERPFALTDGWEVAKQFEALGYQPLVEEQLIGTAANRSNVHAALKRIRDFPEWSSVIVYYSGHGVVSPNDKDVSLQLAGQDDIDYGLGIKVADLIESARSNTYYGELNLIIDAAFSGAGAYIGTLTLKEVGANTTIFTSSSTTQLSHVVTLKSGERLSAFTHTLLLAIGSDWEIADDNGDGMLRYGEVKTYSTYLLNKFHRDGRIFEQMQPQLLGGHNAETLIAYKRDKVRNWHSFPRRVLDQIAIERRIILRPPKGMPYEVEIPDNQPVIFEPFIPEQIKNGAQFFINGSMYKSSGFEENRLYIDSTVQSLEKKSVLREGLNTLTVNDESSFYWYANQQLTKFANPFPNSYAIIVAIDEYKESTTYGQLKGMVDRARDLIEVLEERGFPRENITSLFDKEATTSAIKTHLERFWEDDDGKDVDRLLFYFAGHGNHRERETRGFKSKQGYLIPYDHNPKAIGKSSIHMPDFRLKHFEESEARHFLVILDSCSSGLAVDFQNSSEQSGSPILNDKSLSSLKNVVRSKSRDILVAASHDEPAVWESERGGGAFTHFLIEGLKGEADKNDDKIIEFNELRKWLKENVTWTLQKNVGVTQNPRGNRYDSGESVFLIEDTPNN